MRNFIIGLAIFGLIFTLMVGFKNFAIGREENNEDEDELEDEIEMIKPHQVEKFTENHMKKIIDEMEEITEKMDKAVRTWGRQNFFTLALDNQTMAGGVLENITPSSFTLNTNGFRTNWVVATETKIVGSNKEKLSFSSLQANVPVRVRGNWDGQNLVAEVMIVFQPIQVQTQQIQNLLMQIINLLREKGIDVTLLLQKLQTSTPVQ